MKNNEHAGNSRHAKVIILDNGHGVNTPGKRSPDGTFKEYKWCREFTKLLKYELEEWGYNVLLLVPEDEDISISNRIIRTNRICNEFGNNNCILVSVHNNAAGVGDKWYNATGFEAYTSPGKTKSDKLAEFLYQEIELENIKVRKDLSDNDSDKESDYFSIINKTYCPSVITENMFMDSKSDVEFLNSNEGINKLLKAHVCAIRRYFEDFNGTHESWLDYNFYWNKYWKIKNE